MKVRHIPTIAAAGLFGLIVGTGSNAAEKSSVSELHTKTHIHGLAVDKADPAYLLIATHHGLFRAGPDGTTELISPVQDFMGFNPHPQDIATLYASGHPAGGGNLGFITSSDGGRTWTEISPGLNGPVDFHQMTVSPSDPQTIYGAYGDIQVSRDGGKSWEIAGPAPEKLIDLSASAKDKDILYAATENGISISLDAGKSWKSIMQGAPVTLVEVTPEGLYAFVLGGGLVRSPEGKLMRTELSKDWGERYFLHLAADPANPNRLFAATGDGQVLASTDQGLTWTAFGG